MQVPKANVLENSEDCCVPKCTDGTKGVSVVANSKDLSVIQNKNQIILLLITQESDVT